MAKGKKEEKAKPAEGEEKEGEAPKEVKQEE